MDRVKNRLAVTGALLVGFSTLAAAAGPKQQDPSTVNLLSQEQLQAVRTAIVRNWFALGYNGRIIVRFRLKRDGTLDGPPQITSTPSDDPKYQAAAKSAVRAVTQAQPFSILDSASYENWKQMEIEFVASTLPRQ
jgi:hypothetical protein